MLNISLIRANSNSKKFLNNLNKKVSSEQMETLVAPVKGVAGQATSAAKSAISNSAIGKFFEKCSENLTCGETNKLLEGVLKIPTTSRPRGHSHIYKRRQFRARHKARAILDDLGAPGVHPPEPREQELPIDHEELHRIT